MGNSFEHVQESVKVFRSACHLTIAVTGSHVSVRSKFFGFQNVNMNNSTPTVLYYNVEQDPERIIFNGVIDDSRVGIIYFRWEDVCVSVPYMSIL